jgi:hypothetical protein
MLALVWSSSPTKLGSKLKRKAYLHRNGIHFSDVVFHGKPLLEFFSNKVC